MAHVQTNFRAKDMKKSSDSAEPVAPVAPVPPSDEGSESGTDANVQPTPEEPVTSASPDVPEGSVQEVLVWVDGDPYKAQQAFDAEHTRSKPRATLLDRLGDVLRGEKR